MATPGIGSDSRAISTPGTQTKPPTRYEQKTAEMFKIANEWENQTPQEREENISRQVAELEERMGYTPQSPETGDGSNLGEDIQDAIRKPFVAVGEAAQGLHDGIQGFGKVLGGICNFFKFGK